MEGKLIECGNHGQSRPAFLCIHLTTEKNAGWNEPEFRQTVEESEFFDCIQAWCNDCEDIGKLTTGFVENAFANVQMVCEECALRLKESNIN